MKRCILVLLLVGGCSFESGSAPEDGSKWNLDSGLANPDWLVEIAVIAEAPAFVVEPED